MTSRVETSRLSRRRTLRQTNTDPKTVVKLTDRAKGDFAYCARNREMALSKTDFRRDPHPTSSNMKKVILSLLGLGFLTVTASKAQAQAYSNAVVALNPVGYWPLTETTQPPFGAYIATNLGTAGAAGNGFYETWFQPLNTGTNTLYYQTNNITHTNGAIADGDTAYQGFNSGTGTGNYVVFPRTTNGVANPAITIVPPFSVEFWVKPTTLTAGVRPIVNQGRVPIQDLADYGYATTNNKGFCIGQFNGNAFFAVWNNRGGNNPHVEADAAMTANVWQHMVATFNGTNLIWYRNGVQAATANTTGTANSQGALYV